MIFFLDVTRSRWWCRSVQFNGHSDSLFDCLFGRIFLIIIIGQGSSSGSSCSFLLLRHDSRLTDGSLLGNASRPAKTETCELVVSLSGHARLLSLFEIGLFETLVADPVGKLGILGVSLGDLAVANFFLEFDKAVKQDIPLCLLRVPLKANRFETANALGSDLASARLLVDPILHTLVVNPTSKTRVIVVALWYQCVIVCFLVFQELIKHVVPLFIVLGKNPASWHCSRSICSCSSPSQALQSSLSAWIIGTNIDLDKLARLCLSDSSHTLSGFLALGFLEAWMWNFWRTNISSSSSSWLGIIFPIGSFDRSLGCWILPSSSFGRGCFRIIHCSYYCVHWRFLQDLFHNGIHSVFHLVLHCTVWVYWMELI
mmetsp:Transcript_43096/g.104302  ORF Transcript_43096/g.104302 Transcript_43096/m.104302 type:complete len:371 (+) Transcript_43096:133-1245(+)